MISGQQTEIPNQNIFFGALYIAAIAMIVMVLCKKPDANKMEAENG